MDKSIGGPPTIADLAMAAVLDVRRQKRTMSDEELAQFEAVVPLETDRDWFFKHPHPPEITEGGLYR